MSLLTETHDNQVLTDAPNAEINGAGADEMTIHIVSSFTQPSAMSPGLKEKKRNSSPSLQSLLETTLDEKGEANRKTKWLSNNELEIEGLSKMTLHNFVLQAEALGKSVSYKRTLTVSITD